MAREAARVAQRSGQAKETGFLDLFECDLASVPDGMFVLMRGGETVKNADLSSNFLKSVPAKFAKKLPDLTSIKLSKNQIEDLPATFGTLEFLQELDLSENKFTRIPDAVYNLSSLESLNLSNNKITDIDMGRIEGLKNLKTLNMDDNSLSDESKAQISQFVQSLRS